MTTARDDSDELDILDAMLARFEGPPTGDRIAARKAAIAAAEAAVGEKA